jgi:hypothetical protein
MQEEMHADTEGQKGDDKRISGQEMDAVLVDEQEAGYRAEDDEGDAQARPPEASIQTRLAFGIAMMIHCPISSTGKLTFRI